MAVSLAALPLPWTVKASLMDFGGAQKAALGAAAQRFVRVGSRWSVEFSELPALGVVQARKVLSARFAARASGSTVIAAWPQTAFAAGGLGAPVVDGGGQAGGTFIVRGLTANVTIGAGAFFSWSVSGRNYLSQLGAEAIADGAGVAQLTVAPWIRASPADGVALQFAAPQIEGFITATSEDWTLDMLAWTSLPAFTIQEVE